MMKKLNTVCLLLFGFISFTPNAYADLEQDANLIFNWGERNYPNYFGTTPANTQTTHYNGSSWYYRYYPSTGNYMGINERREGYVFGDIFGGESYVDTADNLLNRVNSENSRSISETTLITFASLFDKNSASGRSQRALNYYRQKSARIISASTACSQGGSFEETIDDANDNEQLDIDEVYSITYIDCFDETGFYQNGKTDLIIREASAYKVIIDMYFETYISGYTANDLAGLNGAVRLISEESGSSSNVSLGASELIVVTTSDVSYWENLLMRGSFDNSNDSSSLTIDALGAIGTESLTTGFSITTQSPFLYTSSSPNPYRGIMTVVIAEGDIRTRATLTVLDANRVRFQFDGNDDGIDEEDQTTTWDAF